MAGYDPYQTYYQPYHDPFFEPEQYFQEPYFEPPQTFYESTPASLYSQQTHSPSTNNVELKDMLQSFKIEIRQIDEQHAYDHSNGAHHP